MVLGNNVPEATRRRPPPRRHSSIDQHQLRCAFCLALSDYISSTFSIPLFVLFLQRGRIASDRLDPFEAHKAEINPSCPPVPVLPTTSPYFPAEVDTVPYTTPLRSRFVASLRGGKHLLHNPVSLCPRLRLSRLEHPLSPDYLTTLTPQAQQQQRTHAHHGPNKLPYN